MQTTITRMNEALLAMRRIYVEEIINVANELIKRNATSAHDIVLRLQSHKWYIEDWANHMVMTASCYVIGDGIEVEDFHVFLKEQTLRAMVTDVTLRIQQIGTQPCEQCGIIILKEDSNAD